jgi:DNA polymerase-3 subunit epsilon
MKGRTFTIIDVETTGGSSYFHRIIEIGALRIRDGEIIDRYSTLVNPRVPIPSFITSLTGITDRDVAGAPSFDEIKDDVLELFREAVFVAHNAPFDYSFVKEEFRREGYTFAVPQLCSVRLSRVLYPQYRHHNLDEIISRFSIDCANRHRALDDAMVVWEFIQRASIELTPERVEQAYKQVLRPYKPFVH